MNKIRLKQEHVALLQSLPETGMGYHRVDVTLNNGDVLKSLIVTNCEQLMVEGVEPGDIKEIKLSI